jgi:hypothetical protein
MNVTGTTAQAVPITIQAIGRVDNLSMGASWVPIRPPANTTIEDTAIINDWAMVNNQTLRGREVKVGIGY